MNGRAYHSSRSAIIALLLGSGALSRAEIARRTGLSRATISLAMAELLSERLVQEVGTIASTGGRRATLVRLGGEARFVIGVAVEERSGLAALVNLDGEVVATCGVALPAPGDPGSVVECVAEAVTMLARERDPDAVLAAGLSLSGQANARERTFTSGVWKFEGIPLQAMLQARVGLPVELHDNAHAAALGELWRRGREHREHLVYFYMGVGVGGAIVAERALYTGTNQAAGEIGAVILDPNGLVFPCHQGCFEGYVSYANLRREIAERRAAGVVTALPDVLADDAILDLLDGAAGAGDPLALEILDYAARFAGQMAANLTNILNPDEIIIGGPYGQLGERFAKLVATHASRTALPASFASVRILPGSPVTETAALGAGAAALALAPRLLA